MKDKINVIKNFTGYSLGLFVHYGLYSVLGKGEWVKLSNGYTDNEYDSLVEKFNPDEHYADNLCHFAKKNGFKYIVLTARHHDGFSLYDTCGLSDFDTMHHKGRDLVKEFVIACKKNDLIPILYHTLIDWREEKKYQTFHDYLLYLRKSVDILCSNYGELGGFWFDGQWKYPEADWEEEKLYEIIIAKQPHAVIVNNAGLLKLGQRYSDYVDVVTYERNNISNYCYNDCIGKYAAEMCQALNAHWGYAKNDINYKSVKEILYNLCCCKQYGGNFLLNIGPMEHGEIRPIEENIINALGQWINLNGEAIFNTVPYDMILPNNAFALRNEDNIYIVVKDVPMEIDENAGYFEKNPTIIKLGNLMYKYIIWLDSGESIKVKNKAIQVDPFKYGVSLLTRIIKINVK